MDTQTPSAPAAVAPSPSAPGLLVATDLDHFEVADPGHYAPDLQVEDRVYRQLDAPYYAWLRRRMVLAKKARETGRLSAPGFATLRDRFNRVHGWAITHLGEPALLEAVRAFDPKAYRGPAVPEPEDLVVWGHTNHGGSMPGTPAYQVPVSPQAIARVDAIRAKEEAP